MEKGEFFLYKCRGLRRVIIFKSSKEVPVVYSTLFWISGCFLHYRNIFESLRKWKLQIACYSQ